MELLGPLLRVGPQAFTRGIIFKSSSSTTTRSCKTPFPQKLSVEWTGCPYQHGLISSLTTTALPMSVQLAMNMRVCESLVILQWLSVIVCLMWAEHTSCLRDVLESSESIVCNVNRPSSFLFPRLPSWKKADEDDLLESDQVGPESKHCYSIIIIPCMS